MTEITTKTAALLTTVLAGCTAYVPQPLDLHHYASAWSQLEIDIDRVESYGAQPNNNKPFDHTDGLSIVEAEAVALVFNPELRLARSQAQVQRVNAQEAGWWPDPQFEAEVMRFVNRGSRTKFKLNAASLDGVNTNILGTGGSGLEVTPPGVRRVQGDFINDPWILGASLNITVPISGRLGLEEDRAWAEYEAAERRIAVIEWKTITALRLDWLEWSTTIERIAAINRCIIRLEALSAQAEQLAQAGELRPTDARVFLVDLYHNRASLQSLQLQESQHRLSILALLGLTANAPVILQPSIVVPAVKVPSKDRQDALLKHDPRILAAKAEYEIAERQLRVEIRKQYPDLTIGPGYSFEEGYSKFGLGFGIPLPLWNHNRQAIAEAQAQREAARTFAEAQLQQVFAELSRNESKLQNAAATHKMLVNEVAPLVAKQLAEAETLLNLGEIDVLLLREALNSYQQTTLDILEATLAKSQAATKLQQMLHPRWITSPLTGNEEKRR